MLLFNDFNFYKKFLDQRMKPLEYTEVKNHLMEAIDGGHIHAHSKLPSERELTERFNSNRNSVRRALNQLECEGYIYRSSRRGWFAKGARLIYNPAKHINFSKLVVDQGMEPSWEVINSEAFQANSYHSAIFDIEEGSELYLNHEIGSINGLKVYYTEVLFNAKLCPGILPKIVEGSITKILKKDYGIIPKQDDLLIRPVWLDKDVQIKLGLPTGTPGLYIKRKKTTQDGEIVQIDKEYWRHDAIEIRVRK